MRNVSAVTGGITRTQRLTILGGFHAHVAFLNRQELAGPRIMRGAAQGATGFELDFVKLDVLLEIQGRERPDLAMGVRAVMIGAVERPDNRDGGSGARQLDQFTKAHPERARDPQCDRERWVGLFAFDLAEHGTAHPAGARQRLEGPAALEAELAHAAAEMAVNGVGRFGRDAGRVGGGFGLHKTSDDIPENGLAYRKLLSTIPDVRSIYRTQSMKALVKQDAGPGLRLVDVPVPEVGINDVLIRVHQTGICGTDLHIWKWDAWAQRTIPVPMVVGHEFVGEIVEVGANVTDFFPGQIVSGEGHVVCGRCRNCLAGRRHLCADTKGIGVNRPGAFAEYLALPMTNVWVHAPNLEPEVAAIFDPFGNAVHTALSFPLLGEDVLVTGAGPIGIMAAAVARHAGARHVVITDVNPYRLELARKMGVTLAVDVRETGLKEVQRQLGMHEGFDVGLEMSGNATAFRDMLANMSHGGKIALLGIPEGEMAIDWNTVIFGMLTIKGIYGREMYETWYKMTVMLQSGLDIRPVITHRFRYPEYAGAFAVMLSGQSGKVILDWR